MSSAPTHSPAPWWYDEGNCAIRYRLPVGHPDRYDEEDDGARNVVSLYSACGGVEGNTDVPLMTAAPALLAALRELAHHIVFDPEGDLTREEFDVMHARAVAAISAAEGRADG